VLNILPREIINAGGIHPEVVSCGIPFLFVPLKSRLALQRIRVNATAWEQMLAPTNGRHIYAFTADTVLPASSIRSRMFAPAMGVVEDPATGGAAAPLAGYLGFRKPDANGTFAWQIEQGFDMGRPSILKAEADKHGGLITAVRVGGTSLLVGEGTLNIP
jgi:trans-2,3-dihydro-3-hydroxyanthranilate isomerase